MCFLYSLLYSLSPCGEEAGRLAGCLFGSQMYLVCVTLWSLSLSSSLKRGQKENANYSLFPTTGIMLMTAPMQGIGGTILSDNGSLATRLSRAKLKGTGDWHFVSFTDTQ